MTESLSPWAEQLRDLGQLLRQSRESQGLQAETVADRLHIGVEQLQALENAELDRLPEPVFVIAQARRVAGTLNLDIESQLTALRSLGDGPSGSSKLPVRSATPSGRQARSGHRGPLSLLALLLVGGGLWGIWHVFEGHRPGRPQAAPADTNQTTTSGGTGAQRTSAPGKPTEAPATLVLTSQQPSWVQVRRIDGATLFEGLLQGSRHFPIGQGVEVLAGRPDLVEARLGSAASKVLGPISDVKWQRFAPPH